MMWLPNFPRISNRTSSYKAEFIQFLHSDSVGTQMSGCYPESLQIGHGVDEKACVEG